MSEPRLPRREFLLQALSLCALPLFDHPALSKFVQVPSSSAARGGRLAAGYFEIGSLDAARTIAERYLIQADIQRSDEALAAAARSTLDLISKAPTDAAAINTLLKSVRGDFLANRVVQLDGWILSRTELEICLLTLLPTRNQAAFALPSRA